MAQNAGQTPQVAHPTAEGYVDHNGKFHCGVCYSEIVNHQQNIQDHMDRMHGEYKYGTWKKYLTHLRGVHNFRGPAQGVKTDKDAGRTPPEELVYN